MVSQKELLCQQQYDTMGVQKNGLRKGEQTMANVIVAILTLLMAAGAVVRLA